MEHRNSFHVSPHGCGDLQHAQRRIQDEEADCISDHSRVHGCFVSLAGHGTMRHPKLETLTMEHRTNFHAFLIFVATPVKDAHANNFM